MSYIIKDKTGNPIIRQGQKVLGSDSVDTIVKDISAVRRSFTICASSDRKDRMSDIVVQEGLDMENFDLNPVILWSHQMDKIPIGRCTEHWQQGRNGTTQTMMRIQMSEDPDAVKIFNAIKGGYLRSASIGFISLKSEPIKQGKDEDKPSLFHNPTKFLESELIECSICSIGANPDAIMALKDMAARGRLPAYCVDGVCYYYDDEDIDVGTLLNDLKLERALRALDGLDDDGLEDEDEDLELEDEEEELDLSDKETRELVKLAVRQALREALGRLD